MTSAHQVVSVFIDFLLHVGLADITTRDSVYQEDISVSCDHTKVVLFQQQEFVSWLLPNL